MTDTDARVWFITGASSGLGEALARHVLSRGHRAVVTARDSAWLQHLVSQFGEDQVLALTLEVTRPADIDAGVAAAIERFGRIDVLVNNAGTILFGMIEDGDIAGARALFNTNVWGLTAMTRAVLPGMRARRSGTIVNISSKAGIAGFATTGFYSASKFAVEGLSEALAQEVAPLGIKVLIAAPGAFPTGISDAPLASFAASATNEDYRAMKEETVNYIQQAGDTAPGDPARIAAAIFKAVQADNPPLRLLLGSDTLELARGKIEQLDKTIDTWEVVSRSADAIKKQAI
ncbi:oxidoreductase [Pseudomonas sp. CMR5c]|uniref:oxidoreductase n=1 Tax=Pseudomonas sp. CMR5c TaxID=658630 RepID=UPI00069FDE2A|nr:oxidoreductase [Pseudomonas sp. CMR5c]AZC17728.1 Dehydrogenase [Pseudomonas sp. CMR5c]